MVLYTVFIHNFLLFHFLLYLNMLILKKKTLECCVGIHLLMGKSIYCLFEEENGIINTPMLLLLKYSFSITPRHTSDVKRTTRSSKLQSGFSYPLPGTGSLQQRWRWKGPEYFPVTSFWNWSIFFFVVPLHFQEIRFMQRNIPCRNAVIHRKTIIIPKELGYQNSTDFSTLALDVHRRS